MDRIIPFNIKRVDSPRVDQHLPSGARCSRVRVNQLLYERKIAHLASLRTSTRLRIESEMIRDSRVPLAEEFIRILRFTAHPAAFFPHHLLIDYPTRHYYLVLDRQRAEEVLSFWGRELHQDRSLRLFGYYLHISVAPILYEEAYLVPKNKYCVYLYPRSEEDGVRVYRSDFLELDQSTPPVLTFHAQDVSDTLQQALADHLGVAVDAIRPSVPESPLDSCPECGGAVQHLGGNSYFCLECNWDNLEPIPPELWPE